MCQFFNKVLYFLLLWRNYSSLIFMSSNYRIDFSFRFFWSYIDDLFYYPYWPYFHTRSWPSWPWNIRILWIWLLQRFSCSWNLLIIIIKFDRMLIMINGVWPRFSSIIKHSFRSLVSTFSNATWSNSGFNSMRLKHCPVWNYHFAILSISI